MKILKYLFNICLVTGTLTLHAQSTQNIVITTNSTTLVYSVGGGNHLFQSYLGPKLLQFENLSVTKNTPEAYATAGTTDLFEPALRVVHADGNPSLDLEYVSHRTVRHDTNITETIILLKDSFYPVEVSLHIKSFNEENVIQTWSEIIHHEKASITLTKFASAMLHCTASNYWLTQFHGDWFREMNMEESALTHGIKIIDSKLGTRTSRFQAPVFMLSLDQPATETTGNVLAGTLAWTGNFQFQFEVDPQDRLRIVAGMNPYASEYKLAPGKTFVTPALLYTYSQEGTGPASRSIHSWARKYGVLDGEQPRLTLFNNWEATFFDFDEKSIVPLIKDASKLGVDLFLLDDGWFGNKYPRVNDKAGLGDWEVNRKKLPHGLGYLVQQAKEEGLKFGIWLEPEMVNPKSELYEQHPDWILKLPNRKEDLERTQLVLDLTNPKVQEFVYATVDDVLTKSPGIAYIKWDCNRSMTNAYSPYLKEKQSHLYIDYVKGLYTILDRLRKKYPHLPMMLCSSGGGRADYGALKYFTEFWPSDNTHSTDRVLIQWGYTYFFPSLTLSSHVTSAGDESLKFKTDVAMMGKMGYDIQLTKFSPDEMAFSQQALKNYERLQNVIWQGNLYRLVSPYKEDRAVLMYVQPDQSKAVLFAYNLHISPRKQFHRVYLQGLDEGKKYRIQEINLPVGKKSSFSEDGKVFSGEQLMQIGVNVSSNRSLSSAVFELTEVAASK